VVLSGWHLPPVQAPLQQTDESVQAWLSAVQLVALAQTPRVVSHCRLQQSVFTAQELPAPLHVVTDDAQVFETGSHDCEQHWAFDTHAAPATVQITPIPPPPPLPPCPEPPLPVLIAFTELLPQLGRTRSAATKRAKIAAMEIEVGEGLMMG
jgi:hypothetical protein